MSVEPAPLTFEHTPAFEVERFADIKPSLAPYLVKGTIPMRGLCFVVGASMAGKTFLTLDACLRIASGMRFMDRRTKQCGIAYIAAEDPDGCRMRIEAWRREFNPDDETPFQMIGRKVDLTNAEEVEALISALCLIRDDMALDGVRLGVVTIDTLSRCMPGVEENSSEKMSLVLDALEKIGRDLGVLVLVVHHHGKDGTKGPRGWSGITANADGILTVTRDEMGQRSVTLTKVKNGQDGAQLAFELREVVIGVDDDGDEVTSRIVEYTGEPVVVTEASKLNPEESLVMRCLRQVMDQAPVMISTRADTRPADNLGAQVADVLASAKLQGMEITGETQAAYHKRVHGALLSLISKKRVRVYDRVVWTV